jgi:signal transduction histidine kinase
VEVDISGISGAEATGDPEQLSRAVRNLVDNAVRHAAGRVTITLAETDRTAQLSVADDGPGIPAEDRERIFGQRPSSYRQRGARARAATS